MDSPDSVPLIPADEDRTLGHASFVTLRLTLFNSVKADLPLQKVQEALRNKDQKLQEALRDKDQCIDHWNPLCEPFRSFHNDIVVPHATESSLPLVVLCEPFHGGDGKQSFPARHRLPHPITVEFSRKMVMDWEGELIPELFCSEGSSLLIPAHVVDCVTFFESGVIAYSLALVFGEGVDLNAQQLLAIGAMVNSAGRLEEGAVRFVITDEEGTTPLSLGVFIQRRLDALAGGRRMFGHEASDRTPFTFLDGWVKSIDRQITSPEQNRKKIAELKGDRELALLLQAGLQSFRLHGGQEGDENAAEQPTPRQPIKLSPFSMAGLSRLIGKSPAPNKEGDENEPMPHPINASIGIEVVGAQWHERVLDYAAMASRRKAPVDDFSRRLAGLAQNVFDFRRQDVEEVNDSLSSTALIGTDITFVQRGVAIRFVETSRAFDGMRCVLGGSPYWLLVQLVLGHNERLLSELSAGLERFRRRYGLHGMIRELLVNTYTAEGRVDDAVDRLRRRFMRRMRLAHYIPNIFRYPTEQRHYQLFSQARGLEAQREYLEKLDATIEQTLESTAREAVSIGNRPFDIRLQLLLGAIGMLQIAGTIASLVAVWPTAGLWPCLSGGTCEYTQVGSQVLLSIAVIAIAISILFGLFVTVWLLRHRVTRWHVSSDAEQPILSRTLDDFG